MPDFFIEQLQDKLQQPLPGRDAQLKMAHVTRARYVEAREDARQAGVMATFFPKEDDWHLVFILRNNKESGAHAGQIGFPGGKYEEQDQDMQSTALRETEEEIGIPQQDVQLLGKLTELYIPVSNFQVHPFVGVLDYQPEYFLQQEEVSGVLEVPISHLQDPQNRLITDIRINRHLVLKNVPYFDISGQVLWGATAMMLSELLEVVSTVETVR